jgi:hypothetical protein
VSRPEPSPAIERAWVTAVLVATWALMCSVIGMLNVDPQLSAFFSAWDLVDVGLAYALAYGIYRRSLVCAILALPHLMLGQFWSRVLGGMGFGGLIASLGIAVVLAHGAWATFQYCRQLPAPEGA